MNRRDFLSSSVVGAALLATSAEAAQAATPSPRKPAPANGRILIAGGRFDSKWIAYMARLTGKPRAKLLYLATASADSPAGVVKWYESCASLDVEPRFQASFINSRDQQKSWEEVLLG